MIHCSKFPFTTSYLNSVSDIVFACMTLHAFSKYSWVHLVWCIEVRYWSIIFFIALLCIGLLLFSPEVCYSIYSRCWPVFSLFQCFMAFFLYDLKFPYVNHLLLVFSLCLLHPFSSWCCCFILSYPAEKSTNFHMWYILFLTLLLLMFL